MADFDGVVTPESAAAQRDPAGAEMDAAIPKPAGIRKLQRNAGNQALGRAIDHSRVKPPGSGQPLPDPVRLAMEQELARDLSLVRLHTGADADAAAKSVGAKAITIGEDIYFAQGEYEPGTGPGRELLAHEIAHTVQQQSATGDPTALEVMPPRHRFEKQADTRTRLEALPQVTIQRQPSQGGSGAGQVSDDVLPLEQRVANFKLTIRSMAQHRLARNVRALNAWRTYVRGHLTPAQIKSEATVSSFLPMYDQVARAQKYSYSSGPTREAFLLERYLNSTNLEERSRIERQLDPKGRSPSGTQLVWEMMQMRNLLTPLSMRKFETPLQKIERSAKQAAGGPPDFSYYFKKPRADFLDPSKFEATKRASSALKSIEPVLKPLGPDGYDILPVISSSGASASAVLATVESKFDERLKGYEKLSQMIAEGEVNELSLKPIVDSLIGQAEPDVAVAIRDEEKTHETWETVKTVFVVASAIGLLLIAIVFPPAAVLAGGLTAGQIVVGGSLVLSAMQLHEGSEQLHEGRVMLYGKGAHDVLYPEQQRAADSLLFLGSINQVVGALGLLVAGAQAVKGIRLLRAGGWTGEVSETGLLVATSESHPNLVLTVDGERATMVRTLPDGQQVTAASKSVSRAAPAPTAVDVPLPKSPPPSAAKIAPMAGGAGDELSFELAGETFQFKSAGPMVRVPPVNRPFVVLEVGAGKQPTNLGLPDEPVVTLVRSDLNAADNILVLDGSKPIPPELRGRFDAIVINNPYGYSPDIVQLSEAFRNSPGNVIVSQGHSANKYFKGLYKTIPNNVPPGFWAEAATIGETEVLGGPFFKATGDPAASPNLRAIWGRQRPLVVEYGAGNLENSIAMQSAEGNARIIAVDMHAPTDLKQVNKLIAEGGEFQQARNLDRIPEGSADKIVSHYPWKAQETAFATMEDVFAGRLPMATDQLPATSLARLKVGGQLVVVTEMEHTAKALQRTARTLKLPAPGGGTYVFEVQMTKTTAGVAAPNSPGLQVLLEGGSVPADHVVWKLIMTKVQQ